MIAWLRTLWRNITRKLSASRKPRRPGQDEDAPPPPREPLIYDGQEVSAARCLGNGDISGARAALSSAPRAITGKNVARALLGLADTVDQAERSGSEHDLALLGSSFREAWVAALQHRVVGALPGLAAVAAAWHPPGAADLIVAAAADSTYQETNPTTRHEIELRLSGMGEPGFAAVITRIAATQISDSNGRWFADLLFGMELKTHGATIAAIYAGLLPGAQESFVRWLGQMWPTNQSELLDVVGAILRTPHPDRRLPNALQACIGAEAFRQGAVRYAALNNQQARSVLRVMYGEG